MKAWRVHQLGEPRDVMHLERVRDPIPGPGQLLVRVCAASATFPDVLMCRGGYQTKPSLPFTPGVELCAEVVGLGAGATGFEMGQRIIGAAALPAGAYGELALMDIGRVCSAPEALDDAEASAMYVSYQTGWFGLHRRAHLQRGETLLVHAAAGGVGSAAVQLGKAAGALVIGVVGGQAKVEAAHRVGADIVIDRHTADFVAIVKEITSGRGADVIYDPVGGESYLGSTKCIAFEGRIVVVGFASGRIPAPGLNHALIKNYSIVGLHWGLYNKFNPMAVRTTHERLCQLASNGVVRPLVSERVRLECAADALQRVADGDSIGRVTVLSD